MKALTFAAMIAATSPIAVHADTLNLSAPMAGGTLQNDVIDMSVYWTRFDDAFHVVAVYVPQSGASAPQKLQMRLRERDHVVFGLPGYNGILYSFKRDAETLIVTDMPIPIQQALN